MTKTVQRPASVAATRWCESSSTIASPMFQIDSPITQQGRSALTEKRRQIPGNEGDGPDADRASPALD